MTILKYAGQDFLLYIGDGSTSDPLTMGWTLLGSLKTNGFDGAAAAIDVSDKQGMPYRQLLDNYGMKTLDFSAEGWYNNDPTMKTLQRTRFMNNSIGWFKMTSGRGDFWVGQFKVTALKRSGGNADAEAFSCSFMSHGTFYFYDAPPVITSITPATGSSAGGTALTLVGTGFQTGMQVKLGGVDCTAEAIVDENHATCTSGAHATGAVTATATNLDGQVGTTALAFTYT